MRDPSYTADIIAKLLDISPRRVRQLNADGIIPKTGRGRYPLVGSVQGYIRFLKEKNLSPDADIDVHKEKARLVKEQADRTSLENQLRRGEIVPTRDVYHQWDGMLAFLRARVLGLPSRLTPLLMAAEREYSAINKVVTDGVHGCLEELKGYDAESVLSDTRAPAEADGEPVGRQGEEA